jgi:pimeloyl-ACP methyl ester carboxylesterase
MLSNPTEVRPFRVDVPEAELTELRRRIAATRWPDKEPVDDLSQGVQLAAIQALARYWETEYDFGRLEARLSGLPHFMTEIDGLDIHFIHVTSQHEDALPLLITHGWPGSIVEILNVIDPLTDPTAHGGSAEDAFHVVIPSMPGYGFSAKPDETGWDVPHIARAWADLMRRLGYTRYVAQGGDWGALITEVMGAQAPEGLIGIHTNMPGALPPEISKVIASNVLGAGDPAPTDLSDVLADEYGCLLVPPLLGEQARLLRLQGRDRPDGRQHLPERDLPGLSGLGRTSLPQPHLLQPGRRGQPLRRLAGAGPLHDRGSGRVQVTALKGGHHE